jgi:hypothetical protein
MVHQFVEKWFLMEFISLFFCSMQIEYQLDLGKSLFFLLKSFIVFLRLFFKSLIIDQVIQLGNFFCDPELIWKTFFI